MLGEVTAEKTSLSNPLTNKPENFANEELARQKLDFSCEIGSKQLDKFASYGGEEKVPDEPPENENKNGVTRTAAGNSGVLFLLLYNCMLLARDYMAMKQQQRDLDKGMDMDIQLNPEQQIQSSRLSSTHDVEEDPAKAVKKLI